MSINLLRTDESIDNIIDMYLPMIYRLALSNVKNNSDAEDISQDVLFKYIKLNPDFECEEHRKNWFISVTVNQCRDFYKSSWRKCLQEISVNQEDIKTMDLSHKSEVKIDIHNAMIKLPLKYRTIIHLFYYEEMPVEQISRVLEIKLSTVKMRLKRGRDKLKKYLEEGGFYFED